MASNMLFYYHFEKGFKEVPLPKEIKLVNFDFVTTEEAFLGQTPTTFIDTVQKT